MAKPSEFNGGFQNGISPRAFWRYLLSGSAASWATLLIGAHPCRPRSDCPAIAVYVWYIFRHIFRLNGAPTHRSTAVREAASAGACAPRSGHDLSAGRNAR